MVNGLVLFLHFLLKIYETFLKISQMDNIFLKNFRGLPPKGAENEEKL